MFKFFKRQPSSPTSPVPPKPVVSRRRDASGPKPAFEETQPVPHVLEGNEQTDWALWEDSMMIMDSQMQSLTPSARIYERERQTPSEFQELDPFARIGKKSA